MGSTKDEKMMIDRIAQIHEDNVAKTFRDANKGVISLSQAQEEIRISQKVKNFLELAILWEPTNLELIFGAITFGELAESRKNLTDEQRKSTSYDDPCWDK